MNAVMSAKIRASPVLSKMAFLAKEITIKKKQGFLLITKSWPCFPLPEKYFHHPFITHRKKNIIKLLTSYLKYVIVNLIRKNYLANRQLNSPCLCVSA
jgi:hypothetical protein